MSVNVTLELLLPVNGVSGATSRRTAAVALLTLDVRNLRRVTTFGLVVSNTASNKGCAPSRQSHLSSLRLGMHIRTAVTLLPI